MTPDFYVVGIGYSAGGLQPLEEFFDSIPPRTDAAYVVVHHMLRTYQSQLKSILRKHTDMPVVSIEDSMQIQPRHVYVLDENKYVKIWDNHLYFVERPDETDVNFAIDTLFLSMAEQKKNKAIAVVLSGAGTDSAKGAQAIHNAGGKTLVQEPLSATFPYMPQHVIKSDWPYAVAPPPELAMELLRLLENGED